MRIGLKVAAPETVNVTAPLVPPEVETVTLAAPRAALAAMVKVAVIWVALATVTALTVMPGLLVATVAPEMKLAPVRVTGTAVPATPLTGLTEDKVGAGGLTVKVTAVEVPPEVETVTLAAPRAALAAMVKVAVIWVALATLTALTVMPGLLVATVAPETKLAPVRVTGTAVPATPLAGLTEDKEGAGGLTVKVTAVEVPA